MGATVEPSERLAVRAMQVAIVLITTAGLVTLNVGVLVNGVLALVVTALPAMLRRDYSLVLGPTLTLWITTAVFLHAIGMVGFYESVWWWDHLTHTLSATLVAGVGYATVRALDRYSDAVHFPSEFTFVFVLLFTLALGVVWEVLEFAAHGLATRLGFEPILIQYGLRDTVLDLLFDAAGAASVALFGTRPLAETIDELVARSNRDGKG